MNQHPDRKLTALSFVVDGRGDLTKKFLDPEKLGSMASARLQLLPAIKSAAKHKYKIQILSLQRFIFTIQFSKLSDVCLIEKMSANRDDLFKHGGCKPWQ